MNANTDFKTIVRMREEASHEKAQAIYDAEQKGLEQGLEKGMAQGIEQGMAQGMAQSIAKAIEFMRIQGISEEVIQTYIKQNEQ